MFFPINNRSSIYACAVKQSRGLTLEDICFNHLSIYAHVKNNIFTPIDNTILVNNLKEEFFASFFG